MTTAGRPGGRRHVPRRLWGVLAALVWVVLAAGWVACAGERFLYGDVRVLPAGTQPVGVAVSPNGNAVYVADLAGSITPVSAATGKAGRPVLVPGGFTQRCGTPALTVTPDSRALFTSLPVARVNLATGRETGQAGIPGGVADFVMSRDGATLYAVSGHNQLFAVSAGTGRVERRIPVPAKLLEDETAVVLSPDGRTLYVASSREGNDADSTGAVTAVSLQTGRAAPAVSVGWEPVALAVTPDGRTLYAAVDGMHGLDGPESPERVVAVDTAANRVSASVPWRVPPCNLVMAPGGKTLWVESSRGNGQSTADNTLTPIDVASNRPGKALRTSGWLNEDARAPTGLAISPDGRTLYVAVASGLEIFHIAGP